MLEKYHYVRAKALMLFRYYYKYLSEDYDDISDFLRNHYNILAYHEPNKEWIHTDKKSKRENEARIVKAIEINEALFAASDRQKESSNQSSDCL